MKKVKKSQPGSSSVHVPAPMEKLCKTDMNPPLNNLEASIIDAALPPAATPPKPLDPNKDPAKPVDKEPADLTIAKCALEKADDDNGDLSGYFNMQEIISGTDYEMEVNHLTDADEAQEIAENNLSDDEAYYQKAWAAVNESDEIEKSDGLKLDLGSGQSRKSGHIGIDSYMYDYGTMVHDLAMGIPFPDESASHINLSDVLHYLDADDQKPLLSEIQRVLMPEGQFYYEGPNAIENYPDWLEETDRQEIVKKIEGNPNWVQQTFKRLAIPDPATANDAEPRTGVSQYDMLPADALLAMDAVGYYYSDVTTSGRGNRIHGYPSQGALLKSKIHKVSVFKADKKKQIVYGVVLSPNETDTQDDFMTDDDIEHTAHEYIRKARVVGSNHTKPIDAHPVESYIAPLDFKIDNGQYGPQTIKKGAWVLGVKINDPSEWEKVENGDYQGFSVGGEGARELVE